MMKGFVQNISQAVRLYGYYLYRSLKSHGNNKGIPKLEDKENSECITFFHYMDNYFFFLVEKVLYLFEKVGQEIDLNLSGHIQIISVTIADILKKKKEEIENQLRNAFIQGIIDEMMKDVKLLLQIEEDNAFENDISILMNELAKIDSTFLKYNIVNTSLSDACLTLLEKWFKTL